MKMFDCDVCMSAGSVNKWGYCEVCGEDFEDLESLVRWHGSTTEFGRQVLDAGIGGSTTMGELAAVGQDAA